MTKDVDFIFMCLSAIHIYFLVKYLLLIFICLLIIFKSSLYILGIYLLLDTCFANILSQFIDCLFALFVVSSAVPKLESWIRSLLFIFAFVAIMPILFFWHKAILMSKEKDLCCEPTLLAIPSDKPRRWQRVKNSTRVVIASWNEFIWWHNYFLSLYIIDFPPFLPLIFDKVLALSLPCEYFKTYII